MLVDGEGKETDESMTACQPLHLIIHRLQSGTGYVFFKILRIRNIYGRTGVYFLEKRISYVFNSSKLGETLFFEKTWMCIIVLANHSYTRYTLTVVMK